MYDSAFYGEFFDVLHHRAQGFRCLGLLNPGGVGMRQKWARDGEQFLALVEKYKTYPHGVYHTPGVFNAQDRRKSAAGLFGTLFGELDVRPEVPGKYKTFDEALAGLKRLEAVYGKAFVLHSGRGYHAYWQLDRLYTASEWLPLAQGLKAEAQRLGVLLEPERVADASSLMRLPGTLNPKVNRNAEFIDLGDRLLSPDRFPRAVSAPVVPADTVKADMARIRAMCPLVEAFATGTPLPEPSWRGLATVFKHVEGGEEAFHEYSRLDPRYDQAETQGKLDNAKWVQGCEKFSEVEGSPCAGCQFKDLHTNPIKVATTPPDAPFLPDGYTFDGGSIRRGKSTVCTHPIWVSSSFMDGNKGLSLEFSYILPSSRETLTRVVPNAHRNDPKTLGEFCYARPGMLWVEYVDASIKTYAAQKTKEGKNVNSQIFDRFGYHKGTPLGDVFVIGHEAINKGGVDRIKVIAEIEPYARAMDTNGREGLDSYDRWAPLMKAYLDDPHVHFGAKIAVMLSFATPLLSLAEVSGIKGFFVSLAGTSGMGKTTALRAVASVWGAFDGYAVGGDTSPAALWARMGRFNNLPLVLDEVHRSPMMQDPVALQNVVIAVGTGMPPERQTQNNTARERQNFQLMAFGATNQLLRPILRDHPNADAAAGAEQRLIEFEFTPIPGMEPKASYEDLGKEASIAGVIWMEYLMQPEKIAEAKRFINRQRADVKAHERFLSLLMNLLYFVQRECAEAGIMVFPEGPIVQFEAYCQEVYADTAKFSDIPQTAKLIADYVTSERGNIIQFEHFPNSDKKRYGGMGQPTYLEAIAPKFTGLPNVPSHIAYVESERLYLINPVQFRNYVRAKTGRNQQRNAAHPLIRAGSIKMRLAKIYPYDATSVEFFCIHEDALKTWG